MFAYDLIKDKYTEEDIDNKKIKCIRYINPSFETYEFKILKTEFCENLIVNSNYEVIHEDDNEFFGFILNNDCDYGLLTIDESYTVPYIINDIYFYIGPKLYTSIILFLNVSGVYRWIPYLIPIKHFKGDFISENIKKFTLDISDLK